jgi:nitrate/nitrite transporter NarK
MSGSKRTSIFALFFSPATLVPIVLGVGAAVYLWVTMEKQHNLALFIGVAGTLGGLGTFMTRVVLGGKQVNPTIAKKRQEMLTGLAELADASRFTPSAEAGQPAAAAPVETI